VHIVNRIFRSGTLNGPEGFIYNENIPNTGIENITKILGLK